MKKTVGLLMTLVMLLSLAACGAKSVEPAPEAPPTVKTPEQTLPEAEPENEPAPEEAVSRPGFLLEQAGTLSDPDRALEDDQLILAALSQQLGLQLRDYRVLNNSYFLVAEDKDSINNLGVATADGQLVMPCEAGVVLFDERQSETIVLTGTLQESGEETNATITGADRRVDVPEGKEDQLYRVEQAQFYSLEQQAGVVDVDLSGEDDWNAAGSCVIHDAEEGGYTVYDQTGKVILETTEVIYGGKYGLCYTDYEAGETVTYDSDGTMVGYLPTNIVMTATGLYATRESEFGVEVLSLDGNVLFEAVCDRVEGESIYGVVSCRDGQYGLIRADGTEVVPLSDYSSLYSLGYGYYQARTKSEPSTVELLSTEYGIVLQGMESLDSNLVMIQDGKAFVLQDGDFTLELPADCELQGKALGLAATHAPGPDALLDLKEGRELLPYAYELIEVEGSLVCAYKDGRWELYRILFPNA